jgi:hypothetical protein
MGNNENAGRVDITPNMNTFFVPQRLFSLAKYNVCIIFKNPIENRIFPIVGVGRPSPPSGIGVARKTGRTRRKEMSIKATKA